MNLAGGHRLVADDDRESEETERLFGVPFSAGDEESIDAFGFPLGKIFSQNLWNEQFECIQQPGKARVVNDSRILGMKWARHARGHGTSKAR